MLTDTREVQGKRDFFSSFSPENRRKEESPKTTPCFDIYSLVSVNRLGENYDVCAFLCFA